MKKTEQSLEKETISGIGSPKSLVDVLAGTSEKMAGNWPQLIGLCIVAGVSCILLNLFPVFGFALSFFVSCFLVLGVNQCIMQILQGKPVRVEEVFSVWKSALSAFSLRILQLFYVALWSLLLLVPGIIAALNYSFAFAVMADKPETDATLALQISKQMVRGYRWELFLIYLYIFLITALVFGAALVIPFIFTFWMEVSAAWLFGTAAVLTFLTFVIVIMPYSEVVLISFYLELKNRGVKPAKESEGKEKIADVLSLDVEMPLEILPLADKHVQPETSAKKTVEKAPKQKNTAEKSEK